jgi:hypothetical protein
LFADSASNCAAQQAAHIPEWFKLNETRKSTVNQFEVDSIEGGRTTMAERKREIVGTSSAGKWTVMVYMAGDDALSPLFVEQLKALKDAGFHKNVNVLVYFDPNETGVPTRIFDVNRKRKQSRRAPMFQVGDDNDSYVRDMIEDLVTDLPPRIKRGIPEGQSGTADAKKSLELFLDYCLDEYSADHYIVVLVGHGMVVGNDAFLPDQFPKSAIKLTELGTILNDRFGSGANSLELLSMHSCAMNGIEVLYELKGVAKYMIGSEGLSFVMGWQYRQLLKKLFNAVKNRETIPQLVESLYWLTFFSAKDFLLAGYPLELSLCSLDPQKIDGLTESVGTLVRELRAGLKDEIGTDMIQLAHLKSQSYFDESYTDLYDFCYCLAEKCKTTKLTALVTACESLMEKLKPVPAAKKEVLKRFQALVIHSKYFGWRSQYSHGLSVYFPWSEPTRKSNTTVLDDYQDYAFTKVFDDPDKSWLSFLKDYFHKTKRLSRIEEDAQRLKEDAQRRNPNRLLDLSDFAKDDFANEGDLWAGVLEKPTGGSGKPTGGSEKPTGGSSSDCDCPSIKNYPRRMFEAPRNQKDRTGRRSNIKRTR